MSELVGTFKDDQSEEHFLHAFDRAMQSWPEREDRSVETSFGATAVSITRSSGPGDPLVLLQGGNSTIALWARFAEAWMVDRPVIAIDTLWDAGRSEQRTPTRDGTAVAAWLDQTLAGLDIDRTHLAGYSYGAWVALNHAVESPERLLSVTAVEPPGAITRMPARTLCKMLWMLIGDEDRYRAYLAWVREGNLPDSAALDLLLAARADFVQRGTPRPRQLTPAQWQGIQTPLMIILAGRSRFIAARKAAAVVRRDAPEAELHLLPDATHAVPTDDPQALIGLVREFTDRHDRNGDE